MEIAGVKFLSHRLSYEFFVGPIPTGMLVLHRCDIPSCINPAHLFLGSNQDNTADKVAKGRHARRATHSHWLRGEQLWMAKLTEEMVLRIRSDSRSQSEIANELGVSQTLVSQVKRRKIWKHV
jgi:hypothetical protein